MANPHPDRLERLKQINRVWELREDHVPFREIAEELGCSVSTAHKLFEEGLQYNAPPAAEAERILTARQVDEALSRVWRLLGRTADVETQLKILATVDKLLKSKRGLHGLDAPKQAVIKTGPVEPPRPSGDVLDLYRKFQEGQK